MREYGKFSEDLNICNIAVISGKRPLGKSVAQGDSGRKTCGLLYIKSGSACFRERDKKILRAQTCDLVFLPRGKVYKMKYTAEETDFILLNFDLRDRDGSDVCIWEDITLLLRDRELYGIGKIMAGLEQCCIAKSIPACFRKKELAYRLFGRIFSLSDALPAGPGADARIAEGARLLERTYLENYSVGDFAEASHISVNTFRRLFRKQFGMSPVKYRNLLRIERARELLTEESMTVAEVTYSCGFENIGHFCRTYRAFTGETPGMTKKKRSL